MFSMIKILFLRSWVCLILELEDNSGLRHVKKTPRSKKETGEPTLWNRSGAVWPIGDQSYAYCQRGNRKEAQYVFWWWTTEIEQEQESWLLILLHNYQYWINIYTGSSSLRVRIFLKTDCKGRMHRNYLYLLLNI